MINYSPYRSGKLFGAIFTFLKKGSGICMHQHPTDMAHNVIVLKGSVEIYGPGRQWTKTMHAGEIFDFEDPTAAHEIAALEPNTRIINVFLNGTPARFLGYTDEELSGTDETPLTEPLT